MIVVCIDSSLRNSNSCHLTVGRNYEVLNDAGNWRSVGVKIKNDRGDTYFYAHDRFITLQQFRSQKLEQIGIF